MKKILSDLNNDLGTKKPAIDFHIHTNWTDGQSSPTEMFEQAIQINLEAILFSEHVRRSSDSWYLDFAKNIRELKSEQCVAYLGAEAKAIDFEGTLDCPQLALLHADLVMGVVHRFPGEPDHAVHRDFSKYRSKAMDIEFELSIALIENKYVDILGHPMGMSINRFGLEPPTCLFERLMHHCKKFNTCFEINSNYHRDPKMLFEMGLSNGVGLSLGSNAHCLQDLGRITRDLRWK